jgi:hypothetical protein
MSISTVDDIASGFNAALHYRFLKNITAPKAAGAFQSGWLATGWPPPGTNPPAYTAGSGYTLDRTNAGALGQTNGLTKNWLAKLTAACSQQGTLFIADKLWHCGGMGFAASTYTVTTPGSLPARITDAGLKAELWVEQNVVAGAASGTLTCSYKDSAAATQSGVIAAVVSAPVVGQMQPVPLANKLGVSSLISVTNSATWTSGSWGMTILQPLIAIECPIIGVGKTLDWAALGLPAILADACLFFYFLANGTTAPVAIGTVDIIDK